MKVYVDVFSFLPPALLAVLHFVAGLVVLAEGLNKLHRTDPFQPGLGWLLRLVVILKVIAWLLLTMGAAGAVATPLLQLQPATLQDVVLILGFAILIIRSRMKEEKLCKAF